MLLPAAAQTQMFVFKITVRDKRASITEVFTAPCACYDAMSTKELLTERTLAVNLCVWHVAYLTLTYWFWLNSAPRLQLAPTTQEHLFVIIFQNCKTQMLSC